MFENVKALCAHFLEMGVPGFDLLVLRDGKEILRHKGGFMDLEKQIPIQGDELYNIYSLSKPLTVTAAMMLWEKGAFDLEDELSNYLPEFKEMTVQTENGIVKAEKPILVRNLFTMTAGFSYQLKSPWLMKLREDTQGRCPTREFARYLAREPLFSQPGTEYRYSLCHDVLAALVEVISGEKYEAFVKKNIFDPMGMTRSNFLLPVEEYDKLATRYVFQDGKAVAGDKMPTYRIGSEHASGGAGCVSTVEEYIRFAEGLRTYALLKKDTIDLITRPWLNESEARTWLLTAYSYGLGMRKHKPNSVQADFGWGGAAGAILNIDIENGFSLYYGQHLTKAPNQSMRTAIYTSVLKDLGYNVEIPTKISAELNKLTY